MNESSGSGRWITIPFVKMHGLGNDFVIIDDLQLKADEEETPINHELAKAFCDRNRGVGADQLLWLRPDRSQNQTDCYMQIFNTDGSHARMCGNGIRAVAQYLMDYGPRPGQDQYLIATDGGLKKVLIRETNESPSIHHDRRIYEVEMGVPTLKSTDIEIEGQRYAMHLVDMGNPHAVFLRGPSPDRILELGPRLEKHPDFHQSHNVEFVKVNNSAEITVAVWERGAGATLACGTGACAAAAAAIQTGMAQSPLLVHLPGGSLHIRWAGAGEPVIMSGPATFVFSGQFKFFLK